MSKDMPRIYLSAPHLSGKERAYIDDALDTNWVAPLGPHVDAFEREVAAYAGTAGATALSSGTAAIHLALRLLDVGPGDTVLCSSLTFVASANPIVYLGAEPIFIDSEPDTWNMSPYALERALHDAKRLGKLPKAVIVVNLYGQSARLDEISSICDAYQVPIIEDAAESLGSSYKRRASGSLGRFGVYSFNGNKIITTSGGGMLVSDDMGALNRARFLATQARDPAPHYQHSMSGYNYRLSNVLAGIGRAQMEVLEERVTQRRKIFERYEQALSSLAGFNFMPELAETRSNRWLTALTIDEREAGVSVAQVLQALSDHNIEARPVWKPLHMQPLFAEASFYAYQDEHVSERLFARGLCLPSGSAMTIQDQQRVIECVLNTVEEAALKSAHRTYFVS